MYTITARNVNHALPVALAYLAEEGRVHDSRYGETLRLPRPVATTYEMPLERVLYDPDRNCNPFFHFFEALWIIAGREDLSFLQQFNSRMTEFSDDQINFHGAYGMRLRGDPVIGGDQIEKAIEILYEDGDTRRCALQIWDHTLDLGAQSKDIPCNMMAALKVQAGKLDMTVFNRSNDVIWGAYGTNVVQFSMLQEYIAERAGWAVGTYTQISNDFHVYKSNPFWQFYMEHYGRQRMRTVLDPYGDGSTKNLLYDLMDMKSDYSAVTPYPLFAGRDFDDQLYTFFEAWDTKQDISHVSYHSHAFEAVVRPMFEAWRAYKAGAYTECENLINIIAAEDWRLACDLWFHRTMKFKKKVGV